MARIDAAQLQFQVHKDKYEQLRADVTIKLKFLEENKVSWRAGVSQQDPNHRSGDRSASFNSPSLSPLFFYSLMMGTHYRIICPI